MNSNLSINSSSSASKRSIKVIGLGLVVLEALAGGTNHKLAGLGKVDNMANGK